MVYVVQGLLEGLLTYARDREPESVSVALGVTRAEELAETGLEPDTAVFTHFYLPDAGASVKAVFGMDLSTPPGTRGRFLSHPTGELAVTQRDDLAELVIVAVPPWETTSVAAFDRSGARHSLTLLDLDLPPESLEDPS